MERHKCKLCNRSFANGRALGGHMRSHMASLPIPSKTEEYPEMEQTQKYQFTSSASSASSSSSDEEEEYEKNLTYGLRENLRKSFKFSDPKFSFGAGVETTGSVSVVLQDRESETESSKNNPTRTRSQRTQSQHQQPNSPHTQPQFHRIEEKKINFCKSDSFLDHEPISSISDATTEEDVAFCLIMLSRDKWKREKGEEEEGEEEDETEQSIDESENSGKFMKTKVRGKYRCDLCNKVFKSYQALGGHRASHKKIKATTIATETETEYQKQINKKREANLIEKKIHECPVCFRVFPSGQALGGHKRSHVIVAASTSTTTLTPTFQVQNQTQNQNRVVENVTRFGTSKFGDNMIDLNLPAPIDDEDISQIEHSAVSDAEFIKT
ncbi:hypothetical protein RJ641_016228 [Dillenia turbinata]|uniref:C2H2-type domain-containing protein n=1 Tax=Dillenia turbinata TaxID=194707 RepID=A0AAN8YYX7_9MAGN